MKKQLKRLSKEYRKPIIVVAIVAMAVVCVNIFISLNSKEKPVALNDSPQNSIQDNYVPISKGWKKSRTAKGDITSVQKTKLDGLIESWKKGDMSDSDLKNNIMKYLDEQGIDYKEVSVTSKGYTLYDKIPEVNLREGGNLYSFVGIYSTGKQNPNGTQKTVCYNWSAFAF
ncbi:hypothetical protein [Clostridium tyrobutyricum]|uniref:hypothetical protein n=1 Tax=Clostridium tyrobutyricum TaxID=1519 RepID=UPI0002EDE8C0|nr:hypothetical protein [Clostridium tyrobutyricum]MEA5008186.1 hypothetical protein [Clostridium tyrobutyricum]